MCASFVFATVYTCYRNTPQIGALLTFLVGAPSFALVMLIRRNQIWGIARSYASGFAGAFVGALGTSVSTGIPTHSDFLPIYFGAVIGWFVGAVSSRRGFCGTKQSLPCDAGDVLVKAKSFYF